MQKPTKQIFFVVLGGLLAALSSADRSFAAGNSETVVSQPRLANRSLDPSCLASGQLTLLPYNGFPMTGAGRDFAVLNNGYQSSSVVFYDLKTSEQKVVPKDSGESVAVLRDGRVAFHRPQPMGSVAAEFASSPFPKENSRSLSSKEVAEIVSHIQKQRIRVINPKTGSEGSLSGFILVGDALVRVVSSEGTKITYADEKGERTTIDYGPRKPEQFVRYPTLWGEPIVTYDRSKNILSIEKNAKIIHSEKVVPPLTENSWMNFTTDQKKLVISFRDSGAPKVRVVNLEAGTSKVFSLPKGMIIRQFSGLSDRSALLIDSYDIAVMDLDSGAVPYMPKATSFVQPWYSFVGSDICIGDQASGLHKCTSPDGRVISSMLMPNSLIVPTTALDAFIIKNEKTFRYVQKQICESPQQLAKRCGAKDSCPAPDPNSQVADLAKLCLAEFRESEWPEVASRHVSPLDDRGVLTQLKRFSKPGGFIDVVHTGQLEGMIKAGIHKKFPSQFKAAMGGVIAQADYLYDSLIKRYPEIADLPGSSDLSCQTEKEKAKIAASIFQYANSRLSFEQRPSFQQIEKILSSVKGASLSEDQLNSLAETAADQIVLTGGDSKELNQVFSSKIYKFAENRVKKALGLKYKDITDLTVVRSGEKLHVKLLGIDAFPGSESTVGGFHISTLSSIDVRDLPSKTARKFEWDYAGKKYSAEVALKRGVVSDLVAYNKSPDYKEMTKTGTFRGVVVAGSTLGSGLTATVINQYLAYYLGQGFKFADPVVHQDIPKLIQERTSGKDQMHYFIKEAHSDGDEKNLFRVAQVGKILAGSKKRPDGTTEHVELIFPTGDSTSVLLSNADFGEWMRSRAKGNGPELMYINSSCWSTTKASFEIAAAGTKKLINIPSTTAVRTFVNSEKSVMHAIVEGVRNYEPYEAIRERMNKNESYLTGRENVLLFPDEDRYVSALGSVLKTPVSVDAKVFVSTKNGTKTPHSIDVD